ncbi:MAG: M28 family metallopeptidase [Bacteroidota bacterium]|nr:M28 family metallopeptidase [Bacteroidota bacterium]
MILPALPGCQVENKNIRTASDSITAEGLKTQISVIASDDFQGRFPATAGETKTINYLAGQFKNMGLEPANNGSYFQEVPLVKITPEGDMSLRVTGGKSNLDLKYADDFMGNTPQTSDTVKIDNSEIVFVGYGIIAPEYNWNDYAGLDVKGKTVLMLVNDPGYATGDTTLFTGKAMTYYGRWTYKYEEAARQGAAAVIIIHETDAAGYPWGVVRNSFSGPQFYLEENEFTGSVLKFKAWVTTEAARMIFGSAGMDYDQTIQTAAKRGFVPSDMHLKASVYFRNKAEHVKSNNVAAVWPGKDRKDEYIIYTAHWDHFGIRYVAEGDSIFNGAVDNATGVAAMLEIANAFTRLPKKQDRSILFLSVTCEEQGLLGSEYYAKHPLFPLNRTVGVINMDALNIFGRTKDMTITGLGYSQLDNYVEQVLKKYGRYARPDPEPEKGGYFRSDHFSFARAGVPSLNLSGGVENIEHGREWALAQKNAWTMQHYHKPSDNYDPDHWDFPGMIADIRIYFEVGYDLSVSTEFPDWNPGIPHKALRDKMMEAGR